MTLSASALRQQYVVAILCFELVFKSVRASLAQNRARKQAASTVGSRLFTRAVLCQCPNVVWFQLNTMSIDSISRRICAIHQNIFVRQ